MNAPPINSPHEALLEHMGLPVWIFDVDELKFLWANSRALELWQAETPADLYQRDVFADISPNVKNHLISIRDECAQFQKSRVENWTLYPNNVPRNVETIISSVDLGDEKHALMVQVLEERENESSVTLRSAQALLHTAAMISLYSKDMTLLYSNPAARNISTSEDETLSQKFVHPNELEAALTKLGSTGVFRSEIEVNTKNGTAWHSIELTHSSDAASGEDAIILSATDVTERREAESEIFRIAYTDSLTGLSNRHALIEKLEMLCSDNTNEFALLFLDLDRFKFINDTLGHDVGDKLLLAVTKKLQEIEEKYPCDAYRLAGDEFVVLLKSSKSTECVSKVAGDICDALNLEYNVKSYSFIVTASVGISIFPKDGETVSSLLKNSDVAMYAAKKAKNSYQFFNDEMKKELAIRLELESDIANALKNDEFELYFQPRIDAETLRPCSMEALIRWNHPEKGLIMPDSFIPVAEETGFIIMLGDWVLKNAMKQQAEWQKLGLDVAVSINTSASQFTSTDLASTVAEYIEMIGCRPENIEIEITESMLLGDSSLLVETLNKLSRMGILLALDDFGTGYSNLLYLKNYPLSCLKIDKEFVDNTDLFPILGLVLELGKLLNLRVVAEGVETVEQVDWLRENGCNELQGYYFSRPIPVNEATKYLFDQSGNSANPFNEAA